ncbi:hypothetical protein C2E23DRAFT_885246 [Lenzites betulinus]|nr:hypothetical protein C2E23DRAFT_885246 [Lenzites betulinus]
MIDLRDTRSWQILRHIKLDPSFAKVVKKLYVRAYATDAIAIYERECLIDALEALPSLTAFIYDGVRPLLHARTIEALAKGSGSMLTEFRAPPHLAEEWIRPAAFARLTRLESFSVVKDNFSEKEKHDEDENEDEVSAMASLPEHKAIQDCAAKIAENGTLRRLHVSGESICSLPLRHFGNLKELDIQHPETFAAFELVLHHCGPQLESLSLVLASLGLEKSLCAALASDPKAVPNLRSFKLITPDEYRSSWVNPHSPAIHKFLANKRLRRLDINTEMYDAHPGAHPRLFDHLADFPELEILGMTYAGERVTSGDLRTLDAALPLGLKALLIYYDVEVDDVPMSEWIDMLRKRQSLQYLHIINCGLSYGLDLRQQLLEDHPDSLELVGYGFDSLRWIERDPDTGLSAYSPWWSDEMVHFHNVEYFGNQDWHWLLKYHDVLSINVQYND